jgi:hypothetical protein
MRSSIFFIYLYQTLSYLKMSENLQFPTEIVELPSKGLIYPEDHPLKSGKVEIKYMTAKEEDILTNSNYIDKGIVLDKLLESLVQTKDLDLTNISVGDKNAILIACRILGYGKDYEFTYNGEEYSIDLSTLDNKVIDEEVLSQGEFIKFTLPSTENEITFKILTEKDENQITKEAESLNKLKVNGSSTTRLKHLITSVNGDKDPSNIKTFVDTYLLASDARALREYVKEVTPNVDMKFNADNEMVDMPITLTFFWPELK